MSQSPVPRLGEVPPRGLRVGPAALACQAVSRAAPGRRGCQERRAHTGDMGRVIGTILGAILAIWLVVTVAGGIFATLKTFVIIGLIAMAVFVVVWLVARRPSGG